MIFLHLYQIPYPNLLPPRNNKKKYTSSFSKELSIVLDVIVSTEEVIALYF